MNEMSGRSWKKGIEFVETTNESTAGQPNCMIPVSSPFVQAPFVVLEFIIPNKWAAWGGGLGQGLEVKDLERLPKT
jgi:hypothetical protein